MFFSVFQNTGRFWPRIRIPVKLLLSSSSWSQAASANNYKSLVWIIWYQYYKSLVKELSHMDNTTKSSSFGGSGHKLYLATIRKCNTVYSIQCNVQYIVQCSTFTAGQYVQCNLQSNVHNVQARGVFAEQCVHNVQYVQRNVHNVQSSMCRGMYRGVHLLQISMCSAVCANAMQSPTLLTVG